MTEWRIDPEDWSEAIRAVDGPQIVVAGPGTGKTEFLVRRFIELSERRGVPTDRIAMLTFSRRAAFELRSRVVSGLNRSVADIPASTFHSLAFRLLERYATDKLGWSEMPSLLTGPEQVAMVSELLSSEDPRRWPVLFRPLLESATFAEEVADFIMRTREHLLDDHSLRRLASNRDDWRALPDFVHRYSSELRRRGRLDYGTLQMLAVELLDDPTVQDDASERFRYLIVDEYQDTTSAQSEMLVRLTARRRNLLVAADPYQSVYSFRGAELHNVAEFPERFRDAGGAPARRLVLTTSFRVPSEILQAAVRLTAGGELPGGTGPVIPAPHSGRVEIRRFGQQSEEAEWIAGEVERLHIEEGIPIDRMSVLVRSKRRFLPELSRALERRSIPHDLPDSRLVDHPAVRVVFDIVQAAATWADSHTGELDRTMRRILLGPLLGVPLTVEREAYRRRLRSDTPWPEILRTTVPESAELADLIEDAAWACNESAADGFWYLWNTLPQFSGLVRDPDRSDFRAALAAFSQVLQRQQARDPALNLVDYVTLAEREDFEATPLLRFTTEDTPRLTLTTLHQAKGLSFDTVFIADAVEGVMPDLRRQRSILQTRLLSRHHDPHAARRFRLQEEMRLAYTAMTRASRRVVWTATDAGNDDPQRRPSRFLAALSIPPIDNRDGALSPMDSPEGAPVTPAEAEAHLRRMLVDPGLPAATRLAAATALVTRPNPAIRPVHEFAGIRERGSDIGLIGNDLRLSPSQAETYATCPRRYALTHRLDAGGNAGPYASFGRIIHDILEATEQDAVSTGQTHGSAERALEHLDRYFADADFGLRRGAWHRRAERLLRSLYEDWIRPDAVPVLLEHPFRDEIGGIPWRGRSDRIERTSDGRLRIVDYKTTTSAKTADEAATSLQLGFYLRAARNDPVVTAHGEPDEAEFWYPLAQRKQRWSALDPDRLDEVVELMEGIGDRIRAEDWRPKIQAACSRCPVRIACPEWPEGMESYSR